MLKLALMQPYFFPYVGYFQLASAVDKFVLHDDVQFTKKGWINRNRLLVVGEAQSFGLPLMGGSSAAKINEKIIFEPEKSKRKICRQIEGAYRHAPQFKQVYSFLEKVLLSSPDRLSDYLELTLKEMFGWLDIDTPISANSEKCIEDSYKGEARVIEVCRRENAKVYINPPGGKDLYDPANFSAAGIELHFLRPKLVPYRQGESSEFQKALSIIDLMMFNPQSWVQNSVREFEVE